MSFEKYVNLNKECLTPLSPLVISRQATINIGTIGHVAHGKSTIVQAITGVRTVRFRNELERNITIKLGYANSKIYRCQNCPTPECYKAFGSSENVGHSCQKCGSELVLIRHFSFIDCPGHDILMATMLNGAAVMDGALLIIAANESCPQPQTLEHLAAVEIMKLRHIIILQNKIDLVTKVAAKKQHLEICNFIQGTVADASPIIPISSQLRYNVDVLCEYIVTKVPVPDRKLSLPAQMTVIRSFDVNKPGTKLDNIKGGIAGGSINQGVLNIGQDIEFSPGAVRKDAMGTLCCSPIYSRILSLFVEKTTLQFAVPGGLIGVGTRMDPTLTRGDRLVGQVIGEVGTLPNVLIEITITLCLLRRILGVKTHQGEKQTKVDKPPKNEFLMLNIGSTCTGARVLAINSDRAKLKLTTPVCTKLYEKVALSRRINKHWRLIGWGSIESGKSTG